MPSIRRQQGEYDAYHTYAVMFIGGTVVKKRCETKTEAVKRILDPRCLALVKDSAKADAFVAHINKKIVGV